MEKRFRRLRAKQRHTEEPGGAYAAGFILRTVFCLLLFLAFAGIRLYGQDLFVRAKSEIAPYLRGELNLQGAYTQSVEAFNQFCDRFVEGDK